MSVTNHLQMNPQQESPSSFEVRFWSKSSWILVFYTLLVILWGAWVRISFSGDGCGDHWPLCHGEILPLQYEKKTWVEFTHRIMSGAYGILVLIFFLKLRRTLPKSHPARFWNRMTLLFMISEALLGAKLVLLRLVGTNDSPLSSFSMGLHLMNSLILVGSSVLLALFLSQSDWRRRSESPVLLERSRLRKFFILLGFGFLFLNFSGALAALSTTLFPAQNFLESLENQRQSPHYLLALRSFHPILGLMFGIGFASFALILRNLAKEISVRRRSSLFAYVALATLGIRVLTLFLASPAILKISHLIGVYALWTSALALVQSLLYEIHPKKN
ncbi:MAG: COX15/CtaA family protein [Bdellovibrio sp.]